MGVLLSKNLGQGEMERVSRVAGNKYSFTYISQNRGDI